MYVSESVLSFGLTHTINATMNGTVNSRPLCERKIRGGHSGYATCESVSQKPKAMSRPKPTHMGAMTRTLFVGMYCCVSVDAFLRFRLGTASGTGL